MICQPHPFRAIASPLHWIIAALFVISAPAMAAQTCDYNYRGSSAEGYTEQGRYCLIAGDDSKALAYFSEAIRLNASYAEGYRGRGDVFVFRRNRVLAVESYQQYVTLAGDAADPTVIQYLRENPAPSGPILWLPPVVIFILSIFLVFWRLQNAGSRKRTRARPIVSRSQVTPPPMTPEQVAAKFPLPTDIRVNLTHPANAGVLQVLSQLRPQAPAEYQPISPDVGGHHPDLVDYIWWTMGRNLPRGCQWIVYGCPALVHPDTGIVFAFGVGVHLLALRVPPPQYEQVQQTTRHSDSHTFSSNQTVYARDLGDDWRMVSYDGAKWVRAAYDYAGSFV